MKRIMKGTNGCGQMLSNETYFDEIWFSGVKTADMEINKGVDYYGLVKTIHKVFCISTFKKLTKEWMGGSHSFMMSNPRVTRETPLMAIRYK